MRIALLFSGRPSQVEPGTPDDAFEEYDTIDTVRAIEAALSVFGNVDAIDADRTLACRLANGSFDIAFNIAEGGDGRCREAHAAAVCEMLGLAATHSDSLTLGLTLDKMLTRRVVARQSAGAILTLECSFQKEEPGPDTQSAAMPAGVPRPETLKPSWDAGIERCDFEREHESPRSMTWARWCRRMSIFREFARSAIATAS